jgi:hypothetical protein
LSLDLIWRCHSRPHASKRDYIKPERLRCQRLRRVRREAAKAQSTARLVSNSANTSSMSRKHLPAARSAASWPRPARPDRAIDILQVSDAPGEAIVGGDHQNVAGLQEFQTVRGGSRASVVVPLRFSARIAHWLGPRPVPKACLAAESQK